MAVVNFKAIIINPVTDPADAFMWRKVRSFTRRRESRGRVVYGAGGRARVIRRAGRATTWSLHLVSLWPADVAWLEDHAEQLLCIRDNRGGKVFGTYLGVDVTERIDNHQADVSLTFTELSHSEAV